MKKDTNKLVDAIGNINDKYILEAHKERKRFIFSKSLFTKILAGALSVFLLIAVVPNLFNSAKNHSSNDSSYYEGKTDESYQYASNVEANGSAAAQISAGNTNTISEEVRKANKKMILTADMNMETLDLDEVSKKIIDAVNKYDGYIQSSSISTRGSSRYYDATIRIPADKYAAFIEEIKENGNTTYYSENVDDITDRYTDLSARLSSLKAQYDKVLEFYDKAETIDELMSIEERLSNIQYEIEYYEAQINNYDLLVAYSTLNITINESKVYTPVNNNFFYRLRNAFVNGFNNFVNDVGDFIIDLIYNIWTIIALVLFAYIVYRIYKMIRHKINK